MMRTVAEVSMVLQTINVICDLYRVCLLYTSVWQDIYSQARDGNV